MEKPWLASVIAHKLLKQIAAATRHAQTKLTKIPGHELFAPIFQTSDLLIVQLKEVVEKLQGATNGDGLGTEQACGRTASSEDVLSSAPTENTLASQDLNSTGHQSQSHEPSDFAPEMPAHCPSFEELLADRMTCIEIVLREELIAAIECRPPRLQHIDVLRRNVASHPRYKSALALIRQLSPAQLRDMQRGMRESTLTQRVELMEALVSSFVTPSCNPDTGSVAHCLDAAPLDSFNRSFLRAMDAYETGANDPHNLHVIP